MTRYLLAPLFAGSIVVSSCEQTCEYGPATTTTFTVGVTSAPTWEKNCTNAPVMVVLTNEFNFQEGPILTGDGYNPPRACVEALGLVDGATIQVSVENLVDPDDLDDGCPYTRFTFPNGDMTACDAVCHEAPKCPDAPPERGTACSGNLSCSYGDHYDCPPDVGYTYTYDCLDGRWLVVEKGYCPACAPNCDLEPPPPHCISSCSEAMGLGLQPPAELMFCNAKSEPLYDALWSCGCIAGNPCELACGSLVCSGGPQSSECVNCLQAFEPDGCYPSFEACASDL